MRILLIAGTYPPGQCGVGDYIHRLAGALAQILDMDVGVLANRHEHIAVSGVEVLQGVENWRFSELGRALRMIDEWRPDVVHIHYPSQGFYGYRMPNLLPLFCRLRGHCVVQTWHEAYRWFDIAHLAIQALGANGLIFVRPNYLALLPPAIRAVIRYWPSVIVPSTGALPRSRLDDGQRMALRAGYLKGKKRLVVFFGFVYPQKGIEQLFDIANHATDTLLIAGACNDSSYLAGLRKLAEASGWGEQCNFLGFLAEERAADLLAVADAVVLPFLNGSGSWNTSIHGALAQGTLVISTATPAGGDDSDRNIYTAVPGDVASMRNALNNLAGRKCAELDTQQEWRRIAKSHKDFYQSVPAQSKRQT